MSNRVPGSGIPLATSPVRHRPGIMLNVFIRHSQSENSRPGSRHIPGGPVKRREISQERNIFEGEKFGFCIDVGATAQLIPEPAEFVFIRGIELAGSSIERMGARDETRRDYVNYHIYSIGFSTATNHDVGIARNIQPRSAKTAVFIGSFNRFSAVPIVNGRGWLAGCINGTQTNGLSLE